jgi:hypothetical protein
MRFKKGSDQFIGGTFLIKIIIIKKAPERRRFFTDNLYPTGWKQ